MRTEMEEKFNVDYNYDLYLKIYHFETSFLSGQLTEQEFNAYIQEMNELEDTERKCHLSLPLLLHSNPPTFFQSLLVS